MPSSHSYDVLTDNKDIYNMQYTFITYASLITKILVVLFIFGFFQYDESWHFLEISFAIKVAIALFLIYRFNSYRTQNITFTPLDRKIAYSAGLYILVISFFDIINGYIDKLRSLILPYTLPWIQSIKQFLQINTFIN
jgi:hypothetical protein